MTSPTCPNCSQPIQDPISEVCTHCGAVLPAEAGLGSGGAELPPPAGSSVPFEDASQPFFQRFVETVKMAFANPTKLFENLPADDIGPPVVYGIIVGTIGAALTVVWQMMFGGMTALIEGAGAEGFALSTGVMMVLLILSPILTVVGLFISAGIYHLMLMILGDGSRGFSVTLRAVAYGSTPQLLNIVPFCGGMVGGIWSVVLVIMGALIGHRTDTWRAILAYFLPLIVCCCLIFGLAMMFGVIGSLAD